MITNKSPLPVLQPPGVKGVRSPFTLWPGQGPEAKEKPHEESPSNVINSFFSKKRVPGCLLCPRDRYCWSEASPLLSWGLAPDPGELF